MLELNTKVNTDYIVSSRRWLAQNLFLEKVFTIVLIVFLVETWTQPLSASILNSALSPSVDRHETAQHGVYCLIQRHTQRLAHCDTSDNQECLANSFWLSPLTAVSLWGHPSFEKEFIHTLYYCTIAVACSNTRLSADDFHTWSLISQCTRTAYTVCKIS